VFEWWRLQPLLASSGRVCAFDRAGLGWSDAVDGGYDGRAAANQLAALVKAAKIPTPFVYIGHSLGANFAMIYFAHHPHDVSALVLIEPGDPKDLLEDFHGTREEAMKAADCDVSCYVAGAATYLGVVRIAALKLGHKTLDERTRSIYQAELARPSNMMTTLSSLNAVPKTAYEDLDIHGFGDTPVLTFASSEPREPEGKETVEDVKKWRVRHFAYLASLAAMSTHGKGPIAIRNSTHTSMVMGEPQSAELAQEIIAFTSER
jgi:pimeloyl-ACP methyl ester carboxylesterase